MLNLFRYVAVRNLLLRPLRGALTALGIAAGVALFISISIINRSTLTFFRENLNAVTGKAKLVVSGGDGGFDEGLAEKVLRVPGVAFAVPIIETRAWTVKGDESLNILGVDLLQERAIRSYKAAGRKIIGDSLTFITETDSIILTESFAQAHGLTEGARIELSTTQGNRKFTIRGMLSPTGLATAYGGEMAILDIDAARLAFGKKGKTDRIDVVPKEGADVEEIARKIRAVVPPGITVERPEMHSEQMERMISSFQTMLSFFGTLALVVAICLIANTVAISVAERRPQIGMLRALGATRAGIAVVFLGEAFALSLAGSALGLPFGRGLAGLMVGSVTSAMKAPGLSKLDPSQLRFGPNEIALGMCAGVLAAAVASLWPALKATQVPAVEAMRRKEPAPGEEGAGFNARSAIAGAMLLAYGLGYALLVPGEFREKHHGLLEFAMQLAAVTGVALLAPIVVATLIRRVGRGLFPRVGSIGRLAVENLLRSPRRTASNVTSLMVGLTLVVIIATVNRSFKGTMQAFYARVLHADLVVSSRGGFSMSEQQAFDVSMGERLRKVAGVLDVYGVRTVYAPYEGTRIDLKSVDEPSDGGQAIIDVRDRDPVKAASELFHSDAPTAMVSQAFALHFGKKTGDSIELVTPKGLSRFRIVGVITDFFSPIGVVYVRGPLYRKLFGDPLLNVMGVRLLPGADVPRVRRDIERMVGHASRLTVVSNAELREQIGEVVDSSFSYTRTIEGAALLVALLGLLNTLLVSVMERTRELGVLRAIGMTRSQLETLVRLEAVCQGGFGALIAAVAGTGLAALYISQVLAYSLGWVVDFYFPWNAAVGSVLLGITIASLAAWYPARRAARLPIVEAISNS